MGLLPLVPALLFLVLFFLYPVVQLLWLSAVTSAGELTTQHYAKIGASPVYLQVLAITFKISFWTTVLCLVGGYPVAYLLATTDAGTRGSLAIWILLPFWTSFLVRTFAWMILLGHNGPVNDLLIALGVTEAPLRMIYNLTGVLVGMTHALMPLAILTMLSVMQNIDPNLTKAAATLGGRGGQAFWRIYFPLSMPGVAAAGLLVFITSLGFFITPAFLGGARETMIAQVIITQVQELLNWGFAGAISLLLLTTTLVVFVLYDRVLGMSTLTGSEAMSTTAGGWLGRASGRLGNAIGAGLGRISDVVAEAWERLMPAQAARPQRPVGRWVLRTSVAILIAFLVLPSLVVIPVSFTAGQFVDFPPEGFSLRWYDLYLSSPAWVAATVRSLGVAFVTGILSLILGTAAAFVLMRRRIFGKTAILALILSPLIMPRIILAVALFYLYARLNLVGSSLGLVLGHSVLALPYVVITVMAVLKTYDERLDQAAASLGAPPWRTLLHVTLPLIKGGMAAAFLFAFITSFDELTIALFTTGGVVTTLPRQMWNDMLLQVNPTLAAVSTVMLVGITVLILLSEVMRRRSGAR
jgi:putative spermidine/putrescine transport system permease protein